MFFQSWLPPTLIDKIDIGQSVAVHISRGDAAAVVVVNQLVVEARIVDDVMREGDAACLQAIYELKLVEHLELADGLTLRASTVGKTLDTDVRIGYLNPHARRLSALGPAPLPHVGRLGVVLKAKARNSGVRGEDPENNEDNDDRDQPRRPAYRRVPSLCHYS